MPRPQIGNKCCGDRLNKGLALMSALVVVLANTDARIDTKSGVLFPILIAIGGIHIVQEYEQLESSAAAIVMPERRVVGVW